MKRAFCLIRSAPWYRQDAFIKGLNAAGFEVHCSQPSKMDADTLLITWNRYGGVHEIASRVEKAGGRVLVAENGYLGMGGSSPKFDVHPGGPKPESYYSLSEGWHNGRGKFPSGGPERFNALGVNLKPWRTQGQHILVCPNRSFGVGEQLMPTDWAERCAERIRKTTARPVRVRHHPGNHAPQRALDEDLKAAWSVVIWSSSAGVHALAAGIPTFCEAPYWILKGAAATGPEFEPVVTERLPHFERLAHSQWQLREIESGEPFRRLLA